MFVLGIVLIVIAVLFGLGVSVSSAESTTLSVFGIDFGVIVPTVFFLGVIAGAALLAGLWLTKKGATRGWRRHREVRALRAQVATSTQPAVTERDETPELAESRDTEVADKTTDSERLATEEHVATDTTDHKQPH
ncbi:hypothetical protein GCM10029976_054380 [Kribbella albertanoniae]|uniref:LapA family protein n=1 Tax=Kribbella albertanoniae TaxID=1266829 RepID=A0A4R4PKQ3_9ACTN|nr:hypothetical protein [Kribbella albertanoniae]TDC22677.1 hypothetical protein E1261_30285 [Kribbella albertanoniae]